MFTAVRTHRDVETSRPSPALGVGLIALAAVSLPAFAVLAGAFDFPGILREPGSTVLEAFDQNQTVVRFAYWVLAMSGLLLAGLSVGLRRALAERVGGLADMVALSGVLTGLFWSLGFIRWVIAVPYLAERTARGGMTDADLVSYEMLNRYSGMAVGEHLGFIGMGLFSISLAVAWQRAGLGGRWVRPVGIVAGALLIVSSYEQIDPEASLFGALNGPGNAIWYLWLLALGVVLLRRRETGSTPLSD